MSSRKKRGKNFTIASKIFSRDEFLPFVEIIAGFCCFSLFFIRSGLEIYFIINEKEQSVPFEIARASVVWHFHEITQRQQQQQTRESNWNNQTWLFAEKVKFLLNCSKLQLNCQSGNSCATNQEREKEGGMCRQAVAEESRARQGNLPKFQWNFFSTLCSTRRQSRHLNGSHSKLLNSALPCAFLLLRLLSIVFFFSASLGSGTKTNCLAKSQIFLLMLQHLSFTATYL
jgi:hypothetical protein